MEKLSTFEAASGPLAVAKRVSDAVTWLFVGRPDMSAQLISRNAGDPYMRARVRVMASFNSARVPVRFRQAGSLMPAAWASAQMLAGNALRDDFERPALIAWDHTSQRLTRSLSIMIVRV